MSVPNTNPLGDDVERVVAETALQINNEYPAEEMLNKLGGIFDDNFDEGDQEMPRVKVTQLDSKYDEKHDHAGSWFNTLDGSFIPEIYFIAIAAHKQRQMFTFPFDPKIPALCASGDFISPLQKFISDEPIVNGGVTAQIIEDGCAECPFSQWGRDENDKPIVPLCAETFVYIGFDVQKEMPFSFRLQRGAIRSGKKLNTLISVNPLGVMVMKTEYMRGERKDYYTPVFGLFERNFLKMEGGRELAERVVALRQFHQEQMTSPEEPVETE